MRGMLAIIALAGLLLFSPARAQCVHDWEPVEGAGPNAFAAYGGDLFLAGSLSQAGGTPVTSVARWSGSAWQSVGEFADPAPGVAAKLDALLPFDGGAGEELYVGGHFRGVGGVRAIGFARWNGASWSEVPGELTYVLGPTVYGGIVSALTTWDDGRGPALYVGGGFNDAGGVPVYKVARWDGASWEAVGAGVSGGFEDVRCLATYDDGTGEKLYVGGSFWFAGSGILTPAIAMWDGEQWHSVGGGATLAPEVTIVITLRVFDAGSGPELYAGGGFEAMGGSNPVPNTKRIARWNGTTWSSIASSVTAQAITGLEVFDDGVRGPALFAAGYAQFTSIGGVSVQGIARYDGAGWSSVAAPPTASKWRPFSFPIGGIPTLWVGGTFQFPSQPPVAMARYQYTCEPCYPDCDASGTLTITDFGCFQSEFATGNPYADCNQNGALTIADFGCFQAKFVQGCP